MPRPAKSGDPFNAHITAQWFNETLKNRPEAKPTILPPPENPIRVPCIADTGVDLARFKAAGIVSAATDWEEYSSVNSLACKIDDNPTEENWGVLQGPCNSETHSMLTISGLTWAIFSYTSGHTHVKLSGSDLVSTTIPTVARIITAPNTGGLPGLIFLGPGPFIMVYIGTMKENWTSGVAECDIKSFDGITVTDTGLDADVYDPLGAFSILTTGDSLYITLQRGKYYAVNNAPCP